MLDLDLELLQPAIDRHPYPLLFATVSGAHLYGFPSPDSDVDLRGVHLLPRERLLGLNVTDETVERSTSDGLEVDLVTHDARKFFLMLLKRNGYVLEQLYSPLVVQAMPEHAELKEIAADCITRHHAHHYLGFAQSQWQLAMKSRPPRVKPLLYVFRVILTGVHLMRTAEVEANLVRLNEHFRLPYIAEMIDRKMSGSENIMIAGSDLALLETEYERLLALLGEARASSQLPETPAAAPLLDDLLLRLRERTPA